MESPSPSPTSSPGALYRLGFRLYRIFQLLVAIAVLVSLGWGWHLIRDPDQFPIKVVKIQADYQHLDHDAIAQQVLPFVDRGFFNLNPRELTRVLQQSPWVADVDIHRVWPDTVIIKITEQQAVAQWGKQALVNAAGKLFTPPANTFPAKLPILNGADNQLTTLLQYYHDMSAILAPLKLTITELDANDRQALNLTLNNGTKIFLGRTDPLPRLQRFVRVYHEIFATDDTPAESVDLRYDNGISVKWKTNNDAKTPATTGIAQ
ncbi:MAG TPA: cell division protein FtsQ/DivIB [Gammaproteobacteria bacterium]|nr:cell division protein FtsQ/DivIB [Gammaproteobacteria bacterium]